MQLGTLLGDGAQIPQQGGVHLTHTPHPIVNELDAGLLQRHLNLPGCGFGDGVLAARRLQPADRGDGDARPARKLLLLHAQKRARRLYLFTCSHGINLSLQAVICQARAPLLLLRQVQPDVQLAQLLRRNLATARP